MDMNGIREHMEVVGSDGGHIGTVDRVENGRIKLTKSDSTSGGEHRYVDGDLVEGIEGGRVKLSIEAARAPEMLMGGRAI